LSPPSAAEGAWLPGHVRTDENHRDLNIHWSKPGPACAVAQRVVNHRLYHAITSIYPSTDFDNF